MARGERRDVREALGEAFARDLFASWRRHGADAIEAVRSEKPDLYVKLVTALLPRDSQAKAREAEELDDAALDNRIAALAAALDLSIRPRRSVGGEAEAKPAKPAGEL